MSFIKSIKDKLRKTIKMPYYYVPPCPVCGSRVTGRYMLYIGDTNSDWQINEALRNGELIDIVNDMSKENCFCAECGFEWTGDVLFQLKTLKDISKEKDARKTRIILNERMKAVKEERKNDNAPFRSVRRFIGKW